MSSQASKSSFLIYPSMLERHIKQIRRTMPHGIEKKLDDEQVLRLSLQRFPKKSTDLSFQIFAEEFFWQKQESITLFPDAITLLENLSQAHFRLDTADGFDLPFESFVLAMPDGFAVDGFRLPSLLVSWLSDRDIENHVMEPLCRIAGMTNKASPVAGMRFLSITYMLPGQSSSYARTVLGEEDLPSLLECRKPEVFRERARQKVKGAALSEYDAKMQFYTLRLIGALGVYHLATDGTKLSPGYPGSSSPKLQGRMPGQTLKPYEIASAIPQRIVSSGNEREVHGAYYRTWYFRQLRAPRYYQGEYEHRKVGTRYTFVSDTVVGQKSTPFSEVISSEIDA